MNPELILVMKALPCQPCLISQLPIWFLSFVLTGLVLSSFLLPTALAVVMALPVVGRQPPLVCLQGKGWFVQSDQCK